MMTQNAEPVAIVSQGSGTAHVPHQDAVTGHVYWTDPVLQFYGRAEPKRLRFVAPRRIIGVTADV